MDDQQAIERYRYMLRTAPPDDIERAHAEAFATLTPEQRAIVLRELTAQVPASEVATSDDPRALARMATRAEMRQPGTIERTFGRVDGGPGLGGIFLPTLAGAFVGTAIADAFFADAGGSPESAPADQPAEQPTEADVAGAEAGSGEEWQDSGGFSEGGDLGGDIGDDFGGDLSGF